MLEDANDCINISSQTFKTHLSHAYYSYAYLGSELLETVLSFTSAVGETRNKINEILGLHYFACYDA
jgi:hypothetical protein